MGRPRKQPDDTHLSDTGTSTVANHRANETQRQAEARKARDQIVKETKQAHKQTADFLNNKPTDSRKIVEARASLSAKS